MTLPRPMSFRLMILSNFLEINQNIPMMTTNMNIVEKNPNFLYLSKVPSILLRILLCIDWEVVFNFSLRELSLSKKFITSPPSLNTWLEAKSKSISFPLTLYSFLSMSFSRSATFTLVTLRVIRSISLSIVS